MTSPIQVGLLFSVTTMQISWETDNMLFWKGRGGSINFDNEKWARRLKNYNPEKNALGLFFLLKSKSHIKTKILTKERLYWELDSSWSKSTLLEFTSESLEAEPKFIRPESEPRDTWTGAQGSSPNNSNTGPKSGVLN